VSDEPTSPTLDAVVRVAMDATGAARARVLVTDAGADDLRVAVALGGDAGWRSAGPAADTSGLVGYVMATGQPQVLTGQGGEATSALCAPCIRDDEVVGALELADKGGDGGFSIDDMELASLFATIAGAAILAHRAPPPPEPAQLTGDLTRLAAADPSRYAAVARLLQGLLHG